MANEKIEGLLEKARAAQALVADYTQEQEIGRAHV